MATNKSRKIDVFYGPIYFVALPFGKGLQFCNSDFKRLDISTSCTIFLTFGPETSDFTLLTIAIVLWQYGKNWHITPNISECSGPTLIYFTGLVGALVAMIFQIFVSQLPKGRCYGNQLNMGDVRKRRVGPLYSLLRHSTTDWPIVNLLSNDSMAIIRLHRVQIW